MVDVVGVDVDVVELDVVGVGAAEMVVWADAVVPADLNADVVGPDVDVADAPDAVGVWQVQH